MMRQLVPAVALIAALDLMLYSRPALGETVRIRSGEHAGFSRIVLDLTKPTEWRLGRTEEGYELRLDGPDIVFDTERVFHMIPRDRIADLSAIGDGGLALRLGCACHARAFLTERGALVIDVADGEATSDSPFERAVRRSAPGRSSAETARALTPSFRPALPLAGAVFDERLKLPIVVPERDQGQLASVWKAAEPHSSRREDGDAKFAAAAPNATAMGPVENAFGAGGNRHMSAEEDRSLLLPRLPDPSVTQAQSELLRQLSRAASQGLLEVELERDRLPRDPSAAVDVGLPAGEPAKPVHPAIRAETSIDRDMLSAMTRTPMTAEGGHCRPDEDFDISGWGDARPAAVQIAERRQPLVGEFDRADLDAVLDLARLYLFLGFGAEARAVISAFDSTANHLAPIAAMSAILDDRALDPSSDLFVMTGCDTAAALWAVLAWPVLPAAAEVNESALLRSFSALPIHLRRQLGPGLSRRLLDTGRGTAARSVRDAIARAAGDVGTAVGMIEAGIDYSSGDAESAEARLDALARSNDPMAVDALILTIRSRLERGASVPDDLIESAEALAFERQDGADGPALSQLQILARGASGELDRALADLRRWTESESSERQTETTAQLFVALGESEDEADFLRLYFANRDLLDRAAPDTTLRSELAERLAEAGFGREASALLKGEAALSERGRRILARAAIAGFDPAEAIDRLDGLQGEDVASIRARALALAGDHRSAASALAAIGDQQAAGRAAWRGGDWKRASAHAPEVMREAIAAFDLVPSSSGEPEAPPGPLAAGQSLIADSRNMRSKLEALLKVTEPAGD
ncbi:hypothetical protein DEA8626_02497 [Defluviimonas aquaemixtae]|uniref:Uncharacterized protein n=1 Tax=Albidovulum aquaemixtae TaxID=1542388 RepID=A0A2R8BJ83_9RHOB|nr:hypothetical protein [Defluviimonas aquaemixtae]SPH23434.1 hypothetical protein DEA8626_02497 [Defluviimonas aquaemixtae]